MPRNRVWVEIKNDLPVTIFKHQWQALDRARDPSVVIGEWSRKNAVSSIREQVFKRANSLCERCGARLTWRTMHMDEKVPKGKGGLVSLDNCWALCYDCHEGSPNSEHGDRRWGGSST